MGPPKIIIKAFCMASPCSPPGNCGNDWKSYSGKGGIIVSTIRTYVNGFWNLKCMKVENEY